ncbi:MAG: DUF2175 family protein [Thermoplasmata archaeon]
MEKWDEGLEKRLGEKKCSVCGEELKLGENFLLKKRKYFHPDCYMEDRAEKIKENGVKKVEDEVDEEIKRRDFSGIGESN